MSRLVQKQTKVIFDAASADGAGEVLNVEDFKHIVLEFASESSANLVVNFKGAVSDSAPSDFTASQSPSNLWDYIQVKDLDDGSSVDGSTGITLSGTDDVRLLEVNTNLLKWFTAEISSYSAGNITIKAKMSGE
jgi:hypothetical protein